MNFSFRKSVIASVITSLTIVGVGCTKNKNSSILISPMAGIFSDRPIHNLIPELYIVTLASPALLTTIQKNGNGRTIPQEALEAVIRDQNRLEERLKAISPFIRIVYRYRMVLNGLAIYAPPSLQNQISKIAGVQSITNALRMERPIDSQPQPAPAQIGSVNSVNFIGAQKAHELGYTGRGMRVGIIDTGVDYTHSMLGGSGKKEDFEHIDPALPSSFFPNTKIVGGKDLVGSNFNAALPLDRNRLPVPDDNPIDESGHGSHVAGTVAGIGDGIHSYSGVAPDASLYAIKVFGKIGSTADAAIIAGLEYAADPNGDYNLDDQLDVVNLSIGSGFGQPQVLYSEAVRNLAKSGMVVVASAGNSGPTDYIVGAPGSADEAISVAASIDASEHNWKYPASRLVSPNNPNWMIKAVEGPASKPIADTEGIEGDLVDVGLADEEFSEELKGQLKGKVAFAVRGKNAFLEKLKRAEAAGAIGAIVYNNEAGKPFPMGGSPSVGIPAIMVSQALGLKIKEEMKTGSVRIQFKTGALIEEPDLIDQITDFSSKGPRSEDNLLKPEIAAPGKSIISAAMGQGHLTTKMDGTSMSSPHMAGVMTLLKQRFPQLTSRELKAIAMNTAKVIKTEGTPTPTTLQGAGRVQLDKAIQAEAIIDPPALSIGQVQLASHKQEVRKLIIRNLAKQPRTLTLSTENSPGLEITAPASIVIPAESQFEVTVTLNFNLQDKQKYSTELDGRILFRDGGQLVAQVPVLAIRTRSSEVMAQLEQNQLTFANASPVSGLAIAFNLIAEDPRKEMPTGPDAWKSRSCDLQSAGYRIIKKDGVDTLQVAFKLFTPVTTWHFCEVSALIDANGDDIAEQELSGISALSVDGISTPFASVLLDAAKAREIRAKYEKDLLEGSEKIPDYHPAVIKTSNLSQYNHSTITVIEAPLAKLSATPEGNFRIKLATIGGRGEVSESDDYMGGPTGDWLKIPARTQDQPFTFNEEFVQVEDKGATISIHRNQDSGKLVIYYPLNPMGPSGDRQVQIF